MTSSYYPSPAVKRTLRKLGADIREARLRRNLSMELVAARASTSRATLSRLEKGDPSVGIGIVAGTLQALGMLGRLADLADAAKDETGRALAQDQLRQRASPIRPMSGKGDDDA